MKPLFLLRLVFDFTAAGLFLFGLSYWWLGNGAHELAGTAMFLLVILHNIFNRRWYGAVSARRRNARGLVDIAVTAVLLVAMSVLLVTSVLISNVLSGILSAYGGFTVRQVHTVAAYWLLTIVAIHLGLRWQVLMGVARSLFGITGASRVRTAVLRMIAAAVAVHGVWSSFELGVGSKLAMRMTLDWWSFEESVAGFFVHCVAVAGLYVALTHYAMRLIRRRAAAG